MRTFEYTDDNIELSIKEAFNNQESIFFYPEFILVKEETDDSAYFKYTSIINACHYPHISDFREDVLKLYHKHHG